MDRLQAMTTYVAVIDSGGFASAARKLNLSPPVVTRAVAELAHRSPASDMLLRISQAEVAMLAGTSVKPPQLDEFFLAGEQHLRRDELLALGLEPS